MSVKILAVLSAVLAGIACAPGCRAADVSASVPLIQTGDAFGAGAVECKMPPTPVSADAILGDLQGSIVSDVGKNVAGSTILKAQPAANVAAIKGLLGDPVATPVSCATVCLIIPYYSAVSYQTCYANADGSKQECLGGNGQGSDFEVSNTNMSVARGDARVLCATGNNLAEQSGRKFWIHATW